LTDLKYEPFRKLIFSYNADGLDLMSKDKNKALEIIAYIISEMADFKRNKLSSSSALIQLFFQSKNRELADLFRGYIKDKQIYSDLIYLDPTNTSIYLDAKENK
jgi:hypothetical protein